MITDIMLFDACHKVTLAIADSTPDVPEEPHAFSADFERKLKRMIQQVEHPVRHRVAQIAASFLLVVFLGFGVTMAVSPTARAAVVGWVKETVDEFVSYYYANDVASQKGNPRYYIAALPNDYSETQLVEKEGYLTAVYTDSSGKNIIFTYATPAKVDQLSVALNTNTMIDAFVSGHPATLYLTDDLTEGNTIVWSDDDTETIFYITAPLGANSLVALAESVSEKS